MGNTIAGLKKIWELEGRIWDMLQYLMELQELRQEDLASSLGGQPVVSKILNGKRELNLKQIRALSEKFGISPMAFI